jgi:hypothetical protein
LTPRLQTQVREIARVEDPWRIIKRTGAAGIPPANATQAWHRLDPTLRAAGLFVVPVGTLEQWNSAIGGHGPSWVVPVLESEFQDTEGPHAAFVEALDRSFT